MFLPACARQRFFADFSLSREKEKTSNRQAIFAYAQILGAGVFEISDE
jgi:hypothetical protein